MKKGFFVFEPIAVLVTAMVLISIATTTLKPKLEILQEPPIGIQASQLAKASLDAELQQVFLETAAKEAALNAVYDLYDGTAGGDPCLQSRKPQEQDLQENPDKAYATFLNRRLDRLLENRFAPFELSLLPEGIAGIAKKPTRYELRRGVLEGYYEYRHSFFTRLPDILSTFKKGESVRLALQKCSGRTGADLEVCAALAAEKEGVKFAKAEGSIATVHIDGPAIPGCARQPELVLKIGISGLS